MFGWLFRSKESPAKVSAIVERLETVERGLRNLSTDWLEFEEKVQRKVWRAAKTKALDAPPEEPDATAAAPPEELDPALRHLDPVSRKIVQLRRRRFVHGQEG
jgi:aromatic ring-opening dioxygenase catalytic subunit (LigB family)